MSYDISFRAKIEGIDFYAEVGNCSANITWNLREMIKKSTGLEWRNCENNGLCIDVIPFIERGLEELRNNPEKYKKYESPNGWGTINGCKNFFEQILSDWKDFIRWNEELVSVVTFWIT